MGVRCMFVSAYSTHKQKQLLAEFLMTKEIEAVTLRTYKHNACRDDVLENITDEKIKAYMEG